MVVANYVKFLPSSLYFEPPKELPIRGGDAIFRKSLQENIRNVYERALQIRSISRIGNEFHVDASLEPRRNIELSFGRKEQLFCYQLFRQEVFAIDEETRQVEFRLTLPSSPPTKEEFDIWVDQSVDRSVERHFKALNTDLAVATSVRSMYVCDSPFS
ncbi:MAG: hypothetical protein ABI583_08425, partial [Betaproteobacteria bacterium]